jgi:hypothetical protein
VKCDDFFGAQENIRRKSETYGYLLYVSCRVVLTCRRVSQIRRFRGGEDCEMGGVDELLTWMACSEMVKKDLTGFQLLDHLPLGKLKNKSKITNIPLAPLLARGFA